jgi:glyoxylase-like metal-dependent hydrolase (beta-lactamase superfamily II)
MNQDDRLPITIDLLFLDQPGVIAAFLLRAPGEAALVEVGPASTVDTLLAGITHAGVAPEEVRHLLVTHIHLDHAGAAGTLLQRLPNATLYVHEHGAPHLVDPSKLIASARRIYGALMDRLWGEVVPVPVERMVVLRDGDQLTVAGHRLAVLYTPGHAGHHVVFHDLDDGSVFAGDVAGVRMQGCDYVRPPTPPPDLDLEAWDASIDRLAALQASVFYVTHFGRCAGIAAHLEQLRGRLREWERLVLEGLQAGEDRATIALTLQRVYDQELLRQADAETVKRYEMASSYMMNVAGYERYLRRRYDLPMPAKANA